MRMQGIKINAYVCGEKPKSLDVMKAINKTELLSIMAEIEVRKLSNTIQYKEK